MRMLDCPSSCGTEMGTPCMGLQAGTMSREIHTSLPGLRQSGSPSAVAALQPYNCSARSRHVTTASLSAATLHRQTNTMLSGVSRACICFE